MPVDLSVPLDKVCVLTVLLSAPFSAQQESSLIINQSLMLSRVQSSCQLQLALWTVVMLSNCTLKLIVLVKRDENVKALKPNITR